jgi:enoyl-CoA hydratase / 3-hydroxyacyl-CoA dehydrogenase
MSIKKDINQIEVLIVGAGTMGASLAQAYAQSGFQTGLLDLSDGILSDAIAKIERELQGAVKSRIFSPTQAKEIKERIVTATDYEILCPSPRLNLVIETATENIEIKKKIFAKLDDLCPAHTVLASNSSSLDVNILAQATKRPEKVVWMHYFYLPHKNRAAEYAPTDTASKESLEVAARYMKLAGKVATPILNSRKGGAADIIFVALLLEASRMQHEGLCVAAIEAGGRAAFDMPIGFLGLMDSTGIPIGYYTMCSFSDDSNPDDLQFQVYQDFFKPPSNYKRLLDRFLEAEDPCSVRWVEKAALDKTPDPTLVARLKDRFQAVGFMTSAEVVDSGVIDLKELDPLCENAFLWKRGPFTLMNDLGLDEVRRIIRGRFDLAKKQGIHFPMPENLNTQMETCEPWTLDKSSVQFETEQSGRVARITLSNPKNANALDTIVFQDLEAAFKRADQDEKIEVILFDSAPIKTFIAGANVSVFVDRIKKGEVDQIVSETSLWQKILFNTITGAKKPRIAIVDGMTLGGGVEVALAFAADPKSLVLVTDRTSFTLPEARLGIYPGMRGSCLLPQLIAKATGSTDLGIALSRYYILAGGSPTSSPRMIKHLGLADCIVPAHRRDDAASCIASWIIENRGKIPSSEELSKLNFERCNEDLCLNEREEMRWMRDLFSRPHFLAWIYAVGLGWVDPGLSGEQAGFVKRIARRVTANSPHAVSMSSEMIEQSISDLREGKSLDETAEFELKNHLRRVFEHPDALEGLSALLERRRASFLV